MRALDVAPPLLHVVVGADADRGDVALRADDVLHGRAQFLGQTAVGDEHKTDHGVADRPHHGRWRTSCSGRSPAASFHGSAAGASSRWRDRRLPARLPVAASARSLDHMNGTMPSARASDRNRDVFLALLHEARQEQDQQIASSARKRGEIGVGLDIGADLRVAGRCAGAASGRNADCAGSGHRRRGRPRGAGRRR